MRALDLTCSSLQENLTQDLALLDAAEADPRSAVLRCWELADYAVVAGRSNRLDQEVNLQACTADGVFVGHRASGGGTVVLGPGCLCFSLILPIPDEAVHIGISGVTQDVMQRLAAALSSPQEPVAVRGISDLAVNDRKFSGNAQRWKRRAFLHHGTILYDFDLPRMERYLQMPLRQPAYREHRGHREFVTNLNRTRSELLACLTSAWDAAVNKHVVATSE